MAADWTLTEVEAIVADYFSMLEDELSARPYSKVDHNRRLQERIGRSKGSIEFKHQNISAVLINFRQPFIPGYLPRQNYQSLLERVVLEWLAGHPDFFRGLADGPVLAPQRRPTVTADAIGDLVVAAPSTVVEVDAENEDDSTVRFFRTDFVRRDAENRRLGRLGEEWVLEFERRRLHEVEKRPDLAKRVEWIADTRGDGSGYDIASFEADERPRFVEVKTTGSGKEFPFMVTANELRVSGRERERYHLYRVFEFGRQPRLYTLAGDLAKTCRLEPTQYRARP